MIGGTKRVELTKESILQRITEYDIYRYFFGEFKVNETISNRFRKDKNPSFVIGNLLGHLTHKDFADSFWVGNCFSFVQQIHGISYNDALILIDKSFGLGLSGANTNTGEFKQIVSSYTQPEELGKRYANIQVIPRKFTQEELSYWNDYYQDISDLRTNNIFSISKIYLNKQLFHLKDTELRFGYYYNGFWKLYRPFADKKNKWLSNVPIVTAGGLENLDKTKNTLICKSLKDYMVCRKIYNNVCYVQNESIAAFSKETIEFIKEHSKEIYYGGDSDDPGKNASFLITEEFGFKYINPPNYLLKEDIKDFAEMGKIKGLGFLKEFFILKKLIE